MQRIPVTGFFRDGCCNTGTQYLGSHTVCTVLSKEFLEFSKAKGNDLSTPSPEFGFAGLHPGAMVFMRAQMGREAYEAGKVPKLHLTRTHIKAIEVAPLEVLREFAADLN